MFDLLESGFPLAAGLPNLLELLQKLGLFLKTFGFR